MYCGLKYKLRFCTTFTQSLGHPWTTNSFFFHHPGFFMGVAPNVLDTVLIYLTNEITFVLKHIYLKI